MNKESESSIPVVDSDIRLTESALNETARSERFHNPSPCTSVQGAVVFTDGEVTGSAPFKNRQTKSESSVAENVLAGSVYAEADDDSVQEVTWVLSKLDIFKSTSSSRRKSEEITEFYKNKLYKCGVLLKKPQQTCHRENPADGGFRVLMRAPSGPVRSETRLVDMESLAHLSSTSSSRSELLDNKKSDKSMRHEASESKREAVESKKEPSGIFSVFSHLLGNWRNRNQPRQSQCTLAYESECEPLRRCHKAIDVRKAIPQ